MKKSEKKLLTKFMKDLNSKNLLVEGTDSKKTIKSFLNPKKNKDEQK